MSAVGSKQIFTAQQVIDAIPGTGGIMELVAKNLGCDRATVWRYSKRYATVQQALVQADESVTDLAEAKAIKLINAEHWPAIMHRLSTKGKGRGYTERHEVTGAEGGPLAVMIYLPDNGRNGNTDKTTEGAAGAVPSDTG